VSHCRQLHVATVSLAYPVRRSQQQFDTYEEDPYWKRSVHLHATELMGGMILKAGCFLGQESCNMLELHARATDTTRRTGKVVIMRYTFYLRYKIGTHLWNKSLRKKRFDYRLSKYRAYGLVSISRYYWLLCIIPWLSLVTPLPKLVKKCFILHGIWISITVYTRTLHWTILCQVPHNVPFKICFNIITTSKPKSRQHFFRLHSLKFCVRYTYHPTSATCHERLILLDVAAVKIFVARCKLESAAFFSVLFLLHLNHKLIFWKYKTKHQVHIKPQLKLKIYNVHFDLSVFE
jgi:hypothetical protein